MILILRHPCAVALSYAKHNFKDVVDALLAQPQLLEDFLGPYADELRQTESAFERAVYTWCIETLVPLRQFRPGELHVVSYERLVTDPEPELRRLWAFLGQPYDPTILDRLAKPSLTSRKDSAIINGEDPLEAWRTELDAGQRRRALEIVGRFGLDTLYGDDPIPDTERIAAVMAS